MGRWKMGPQGGYWDGADSGPDQFTPSPEQQAQVAGPQAQPMPGGPGPSRQTRDPNAPGYDPGFAGPRPMDGSIPIRGNPAEMEAMRTQMGTQGPGGYQDNAKPAYIDPQTGKQMYARQGGGETTFSEFPPGQWAQPFNLAPGADGQWSMNGGAPQHLPSFLQQLQAGWGIQKPGGETMPGTAQPLTQGRPGGMAGAAMGAMSGGGGVSLGALGKGMLGGLFGR